MPVVIEMEDENERMLVTGEKLMQKRENLSSEEEQLLKLFANLIEDWAVLRSERRRPREVLQHLDGGP